MVVVEEGENTDHQWIDVHQQQSRRKRRRRGIQNGDDPVFTANASIIRSTPSRHWFHVRLVLEKEHISLSIHLISVSMEIPMLILNRWHFHDKKGSMRNLQDYDWRNTSKVPVFVSDFNEASLPETPTLYMVPRGYLKYRYFADIAELEGGEGHSKLYNDQNIRRIKDYLEYRDIARRRPELLQWDHKVQQKIRPSIISAIRFSRKLVLGGSLC